MYRIAVLALVACAAAKLDVPGTCPQVIPVDNFDYESFRNGVWYEVGRTDHKTEEGGQCSYTEYTPFGEGFNIKSYHVKDGELKEIDGYARLAPEAGKMIHSLPYGANGEITDSLLNVLATDNKNYAVLYYCNYNAQKKSHQNLVWVFSRSKQLSAEETAVVEATYKAYPFLDKEKLIKVDFSEEACQISAASVEVPGFCPYVKTVESFDIKSFGNGVWYELARTPHISEKDGQCSYVEYTPYGTGFHVKNYHVEAGELKLIEGYAKAASEAGKMIHSLPYGANGAFTNNVLNVLATDNDDYAVLYHCNYNAQKKSHHNLVWVFSRSKELSAEGIAAVDAVFNTYTYLRRNELINIDFSENACQISAASVDVPGFCPEVKTAQNFDFKSFGNGVWYETARTPHVSEKGGQCSYTKYTPSGEGFNIKSYHIENGEQKEIEGYAKPAPEAGKMIHSLPYGVNGEFTDSVLNVLATDNKNYAIVYYCNYNPEKKSHQNLLWVFSRSKGLRTEDNAIVEAVYKANPYLRREELIKVDLSKQACKVTVAKVEGSGYCPKVKTVENFDVKSFGNGVWYEVFRTDHITEKDGQCSYAEYTPNGERFDVKNYHVESGELKEIEGYAKAASEAGKMIHSLPYGVNGEITDSLLNVLATDNKNYAVLYYCNFNAKDPSHRNLVWVFSRTKELSAEANAAVDAVFTANPFLKKDDLIKVNFSKQACQITSASVEVSGFCPIVKTVENFDVKSFGNGVWYEIARSPHLSEKGGQCSYTKYTPAAEGFHVSSYHVNAGELKFIEGYAKAAGEAGKMIHSLPYGANGAITDNVLNVLATDNDNYAVLYYCNYNAQKKSHRNLIWVFSRSKELSAEGSAAVETVFNTNPYLRREELIDIDFSEQACQITAGSVEVPGQCPQDVKTVGNFDVQSFGNGVWYEVARTPHLSEKGGQCSYTKYTPAANGFHVSNYHVESGKLRSIEGYAKAAREAGKMIHSLPYGDDGEITHSELNVLATNNKNYAILYHCNYNAQKNSHRNLVWVFSRTKQISDESSAALNTVFKRNNYLRKEELIKVDFSQQACQITAASVEVPGFCPQVKTVENFDLESFRNGVWYEVARTPHVAEKGGKCSYTEYTPFGEGFNIKSYHIRNGKLKKIEGYAKPAPESGKMIHSLAYGENGAVTDNELNVLATDNNNYAVLYHCNFNAQKKSHRNLLWVFSRSKEISEEGKDAVKSVFDANSFLRPEEFITVDFSEKACQIEVPDCCPQVKTVENFDFKSFGNGVWYEVIRTPHKTEEGGKCSYTNYNPSGHGFDIESFHINDGQLKKIGGYARLAPGVGQMIHSLPYGVNGEITNSVLNVLATDNKNYAILYFCNHNKQSHENLLWVFSRTTQLSQEGSAALERVLKDYPVLAQEQLIQVDFSSEACQVEGASEEVSGACPDVKAVKNFDYNSFGNGVWYENLKYQNRMERNGKCGYTKYTPSANGFDIINYHVDNNQLKKIEGKGKFVGPGKMIHSLPYGPNGEITDSLLNVLATDNKNYAVLYYCDFNAQKNSHQNFAWVFSRSKELKSETINAMLTTIKTNPFLKKEYFVEGDFSEDACNFAS